MEIEKLQNLAQRTLVTQEQFVKAFGICGHVVTAGFFGQYENTIFGELVSIVCFVGKLLLTSFQGCYDNNMLLRLTVSQQLNVHCSALLLTPYHNIILYYVF